jgi:hypothetical protein
MRTSLRSTSQCHVALTAILVCAAGVALADTASTAPAAQSLPTEWKAWHGHYYRLEADGHLSCYSENSKENACSINAPVEEKAQPLKCNDARWGGKERKRTGYQVAGHWCNTAYANLFAKWVDHSAVGHPYYLATTPRGDTMCRSSDGVACTGVEAPQPSQAPSAQDIQPLVCGRMMRKRAGFSGYEKDRASHWCQSPEVVAVSAYNRPFFGTTLRFPVWNADDRMTVTVQVDAGRTQASQVVLHRGDSTRSFAYNPLKPEPFTYNGPSCRSPQDPTRHTLVLRFNGAFEEFQKWCAPGWHAHRALDAALVPLPGWAETNAGGSIYWNTANAFSELTVEPNGPYESRDFRLGAIVVTRQRRLPADL